MRYRLFCSIYFFLLIFGMVACSPEPVIATPGPVLASQAPTIISSSPTSHVTVIPSSSPTRVRDTATPAFHLCSPLAGYSFLDLEAAISNPYNPPELGSDDPHQGVDLAVKQGEIALSGDPVYAVTSGKVAAVVGDRFPYGNAIMVETPLDNLPAAWLDEIHVPTPAPRLGPHPSLTCPEISPLPEWNSNRRSLYLLYAHLLEPVEYSLEETIECGDLMGKIGQSGNALNPHLHLEARVGPSDSIFNGLAHYDSRVSSEEMYYYCTWRVSGLFQLVDPLGLLSLVQ